MKFLTLIAAALIAMTGTTATAAPAPAQDRVVVRERIVSPRVRNTRVVSRQRTVTRRGYDRPRYRSRSVCRTTVRYGERRRVCRRVR